MNEYKKEVYIQLIVDAIGTEKLTHFAQRAGISAGNLSRIRKGQIANPETLRKIADASDTVSYDDLMKAAGFSSDLLADSGHDSFRKGIIRIPVVTDLNCSKSDLLKDESLDFEMFYAFSFDVKNSFEDGEYIYFVANDDAIVPKGSRVLIDLSKTPKDGDTVLFLMDGEKAMLRRLTKNGRSYFCYGNDLGKYPMTPVKKSQMTIYGVAVQANIYF